MKVILTLPEVKTIIAAKLGLTCINFDLEIDDGAATLVSILVELEAAKATVATGNKIGAIKAFRENALKKYDISYGLWEAKTVIENLESAIIVAKLSRNWPVPDHGSDGANNSFVWKK